MIEKKVALGWDGYPTILIDDRYVYPRRLEEIVHAEYYPEKIPGEWPKDPKTGEALKASKINDTVFIEETQRTKIPKWPKKIKEVHHISATSRHPRQSLARVVLRMLRNILSVGSVKNVENS